MLFIYLFISLLISKIALEILYKVKPNLAIGILKFIKLYIFKMITLYSIITILFYKEIKYIHYAYGFFILLTIGCIPMMIIFDKNQSIV